MDIHQIIKDCGGPQAISEESGGEISVWAPKKWPKAGIPEWHWPVIMRLSGRTESELHAVNEAARKTQAAVSTA